MKIQELQGIKEKKIENNVESWIPHYFQIVTKRRILSDSGDQVHKWM